MRAGVTIQVDAPRSIRHCVFQHVVQDAVSTLPILEGLANLWYGLATLC